MLHKQRQVIRGILFKKLEVAAVPGDERQKENIKATSL